MLDDLLVYKLDQISTFVYIWSLNNYTQWKFHIIFAPQLHYLYILSSNYRPGTSWTQYYIWNEHYFLVYFTSLSSSFKLNGHVFAIKIGFKCAVQHIMSIESLIRMPTWSHFPFSIVTLSLCRLSFMADLKCVKKFTQFARVNLKFCVAFLYNRDHVSYILMNEIDQSVRKNNSI